MKRELRRVANQPKEQDEPADLFQRVESLIEGECDTRGIDCFEPSELSNPSAVVADTTRAVVEFITKECLEVRIITNPTDVPRIPENFLFSCDPELECCGARMRKGERLTIAAVCEEGQLIGYAIAKTYSDHTDIETLDVDRYSRRSAGGFGLKFATEGKTFEVGVAHAAIKALIESCSGPLRANAANAASQYVFESLGFVFEKEAIEGVDLILVR